MSKTTELGPSGAAESALSKLAACMADELVEAKNLVAAAKREERRLEKQVELAAQAAEQWGQRAMSAVRAGDDVIAKDALVRRSEFARKADEFKAAEGEQRRQVERLKAALSEQNLRLEQTKHRKNALLLRAKQAGALATLDSAAHRAEPTLELLARLEASVAAMEREGSVARELTDEAIAGVAGEGVDKGRLEADLVLLRRLAKAPVLTTKPLAKTTGGESDAERARAGASRERRTKR
jgi:phage shock protein A